MYQVPQRRRSQHCSSACLGADLTSFQMFGGAVGYIGRGVMILTYDAKAFVSIAFFVALRATDGILSFFFRCHWGDFRARDLRRRVDCRVDGRATGYAQRTVEMALNALRG